MAEETSCDFDGVARCHTLTEKESELPLRRHCTMKTCRKGGTVTRIATAKGLHQSHGRLSVVSSAMMAD